jgi:hypothetical protein
MLISDSHKFIFVHNYKVAGSSIEQALQQYGIHRIDRMNWFNRLLARLSIRASRYPRHLTATEIRERVPKIWEDYFTFGFVRNPWSWQVSLYFYMLQEEDHFQHDLIASMDGFEEYIEWRIHEDKHLQSEFFYDTSGEMIVDFVGHLETIQSDFQNICRHLGLKANLPHENASDHRDYREYYNGRTRRLVEEHFRKDIERFGYSFEK